MIEIYLLLFALAFVCYLSIRLMVLSRYQYRGWYGYFFAVVLTACFHGWLISVDAWYDVIIPEFSMLWSSSKIGFAWECLLVFTNLLIILSPLVALLMPSRTSPAGDTGDVERTPFLMDDLPTLRFCSEVLSQRETENSKDAWLWGLRKKVVDHFLQYLEAKEVEEDPINRSALINENKQEILSTHPLLQKGERIPSYYLKNLDSTLVEEVRRKTRKWRKSIGAGDDAGRPT